jgi:RNA-directed DNA polymerase
MRELHVEGVAIHDDPEPCGGIREDAVEAWDRGTCGPGIEPRNQAIQSADAVNRSGRQHTPNREREARCGSARSQTPCTHGTSLRENREISGQLAAMASRRDASGRP